MKRNFTFSKFRIKGQKLNLNFMDAFGTKDKNDKTKNQTITKVNSLLKNKIKIIPSLKNDIQKKESNTINNKTLENSKKNIQNNAESFNNFSNSKKAKLFKNEVNNIIIQSKKKDNTHTPMNNSNSKKKIKLSIPINKTQVKPFQNVNQNYVININNNINNSYQIKMHNNQEINKDNCTYNKDNNYDFGKIKIVQSEDGNKNCNSSNQKTVLTEISDLSCFKSNHKLFNLNSINSFVKNDDDFLSFSDDTIGTNLKNNKSENKNVSGGGMKKKIYINPVDFQNFCKEIEEKLNI